MRQLALNRFAPVVCKTCGRKVARASRTQLYCSARCQEKGRTRVRKAGLTTDTRAPCGPPKFVNKNSALQGRKIASDPRKIRGKGWQAPANVIDAVCPAGIEQVSSDGVRCFVTQLTRPALVSGGA